MTTADPGWRRFIGSLCAAVGRRPMLAVAAAVAVAVSGIGAASVLNPDLAILPPVMRRPPQPAAGPARPTTPAVVVPTPSPSPSRSRRPPAPSRPAPTTPPPTGGEVQVTQSPPVLLSYEAEAAQRSSQPRERSVAEASGGRVMGWIGQVDEYIRFTAVNVPKAGRYTLTVYYICGEGAREAAVVINGGPSLRRTYAASTDWYDIDSLVLSVDLRAGTNTIEFRNVNPNYAPNLDRITVSN